MTSDEKINQLDKKSRENYEHNIKIQAYTEDNMVVRDKDDVRYE